MGLTDTGNFYYNMQKQCPWQIRKFRKNKMHAYDIISEHNYTDIHTFLTDLVKTINLTQMYILLKEYKIIYMYIKSTKINMN